VRTKYEYPPINELVMAIYLKEPIISFRAEHVGLYWSIIKADFPLSAQNVTIGTGPIQVPNEIFPMPRFWFISEDDVYVIQIQRNALILNWRKRQQSYPHYEQFKQKFIKNYDVFENFLKNNFGVEHIFVESCELTYINLIEDVEYLRSFADIRNVIPTYAPPSIGVSQEPPSKFNLSYIYQIQKELVLTLNLQSRQNINTGKDVLYFELRSTAAPSNGMKSDAYMWFDRAHDVIGESFNYVTSEDVQMRYWQVRED
jgi:uncharacterized protein (TIGR04255 family)